MLKALARVWDDAINNPLTLSILGWHHEMVNLADYWVRRDIDEAAQIFLIFEQVYMHPAGRERLSATIPQKYLQARAVAKAPV
nr:hypothetical protein [Pseudomonas sp. BIGb0427]